MKKTIIALLFSASLFSGCSDWFDVNPPTQVKADELFSTEQGFYDAVIGIYLNLASPDLYGQQLAYGFSDILSNMYQTAPLSANDYIQMHDYENMNVKDRATAFWGKLYTVVSGCNSVMEYLEKSSLSFYPGNRDLVEGEIRAIRAFLHFEVLRLYAPAPLVGADKKAIPYIETIRTTPAPQLSVSQAMQKIIHDLTLAHDLLKKSDPLLSGKNETIGNFMESLTPVGFRQSRKSRFNYYVVTALLARVYLYNNDTKNAYKYALEAYKGEYAKFVALDKYTWTVDLFGYLYRKPSKIESESKKYFSADAANDKLLVSDDAQKVIFEIEKYQSVDIRKLQNFSSRDNNPEKFLNKYFSGDCCYPIIKRSEICLILAETATQNGDDPLKYLNELRQARGLGAFPLTDSDNLKQEIEKEYRKEFIGEGQLFYYFKRNATESFTGNNQNIVKMTEKDYVLPITDSEKIFGNIEQ